MYISKLNISGYKNSKNDSEIEFNKGLNILVGENGSGKTTIINSLRLILKENEFSHINLNEDDFYRSLDNKEVSENIKIDVCFNGLTSDEEITFLTWCNADLKAQLHLEINSTPNIKGYYKKEVWGGNSKSSIFEEETFECIDCIYLPPLRDAEERLTNGRKSRLALLLRKQYGDNKESLVKSVQTFNNQITSNHEGKYDEIAITTNNINHKLVESLGEQFGQSINLQFADTTFNKIVESIKMVFFPKCYEKDINKFRDIAINSLGYNNMLYIATVFAELELLKDNNLLTVLLIEEPEAHLHPQLQVKFIQYIEKLLETMENVQVIMTTHSPVLASSVSIDKLIHIKDIENNIKSTSLRLVELASSKNYINRWLDVTKSTLLFSRGIILVEGISETMLIPEIAKIVLAMYNSTHSKPKIQTVTSNHGELPNTLEEAGVSVININGINFKHFMKLFANFEDSNSKVKLPIRCSGITDNDPQPVDTSFPTFNNLQEGKNEAIKLIDVICKSENGRLYCSPLKTFEYDLAMYKNTKIMAETIKEIWLKDGTVKPTCGNIIARENNYEDELQLKEDSEFIYKHIDNKDVGKGIFSQELADKIKNLYNEKISQSNIDKPDIEKVSESICKILNVPDYLYKAIIWACGGDING